MAEQNHSTTKSRRFWVGVAVGAVAVVVIGTIWLAVSMSSMGGACPMCGMPLDEEDERKAPMPGMSGMMGSGGTANEDMSSVAMMGEMEMSGGMMEDMQVIHRLLTQHERIARRVEEIPGGIESWTESNDPQVAELIRTHVSQMKDRIERGQPIRMMDPVFRELFRHHEAIDMQVEATEGGVHVIETSENPQVVKLIRQHAQEAVSEFVDEGMRRAMQPTPLPEDYQTSK